MRVQATVASDEKAIRALYQQMIDGWNKRDAATIAALFAEEDDIIDFDGSQLQTPAEISGVRQQIFTDHQMAPYVVKIHNVRFLTPESAILCAIVGMVPPGQTERNAQLNAWQTLVTIKHAGMWQIVTFQNTPAQFHGRPDLSQRLTEELSETFMAVK